MLRVITTALAVGAAALSLSACGTQTVEGTAVPSSNSSASNSSAAPSGTTGQTLNLDTASGTSMDPGYTLCGTSTDMVSCLKDKLDGVVVTIHATVDMSPISTSSDYYGLGVRRPNVDNPWQLDCPKALSGCASVRENDSVYIVAKYQTVNDGTASNPVMLLEPVVQSITKQ